MKDNLKHWKSQINQKHQANQKTLEIEYRNLQLKIQKEYEKQQIIQQEAYLNSIEEIKYKSKLLNETLELVKELIQIENIGNQEFMKLVNFKAISSLDFVTNLIDPKPRPQTIQSLKPIKPQIDSQYFTVFTNSTENEVLKFQRLKFYKNSNIVDLMFVLVNGVKPIGGYDYILPKLPLYLNQRCKMCGVKYQVTYKKEHVKFDGRLMSIRGYVKSECRHYEWICEGEIPDLTIEFEVFGKVYRIP
jgi:hypothetical protein